MASILYAEVYLICMIITCLCLYWSAKRGSSSAADMWLHGTMIIFLINFASNFLFTLFNGVFAIAFLRVPISYFFKSVYHITLCSGIFSWCGFARTEHRSHLLESRKGLLIMMLPLYVMIGLIVANLWTHWLFEIAEDGTYIRHWMFQYEMGALMAMLLIFSIPMIRHTLKETDPVKREYQLLISLFPLAMLAAWLLSFVGESVPVICVCLTIHLLCLHMSASSQQISMDKLTQVNNRQNLLGYMDYKINNHDELLFLLMIDVDYFKGINDTYGHLEGDAALVRVTRALKEACVPVRRRPYIARYGGDEFMVFMEGSKAEADALCVSIHETLDRINAEANAPYRLGVSIGVGSWWPSMNVKDLIAKADEALYEIKQERDKKH